MAPTTTLIDKLHRDHINQAGLIDMAERALDAVEGGESADYGLLEQVMRYMTGYPDLHHHPVEDVIFRQLMRRDPALAKTLQATLGEHEDIVAAGKRFLDSIAAAEDDAFISRERIVAQGRDYIGALRKHMSLEESELFPAARPGLSAADWHEVESQIERRPDPLFGATRDADFERLWQLIQLHAKSA